LWKDILRASLENGCGYCDTVPTVEVLPDVKSAHGRLSISKVFAKNNYTV